MRLAVLDVGSNTAHLAVVDGRPDGTFAVVGRERQVLRLADAAFPSFVLPPEAEQRLTETVAAMQKAALGLDVDAMVGFATSALREARNGAEVLARVREATGVQVDLLPGAEEARLTYLAARRWASFSARNLLVLDIGGGSFEVAGGAGEQPVFAESLPLGASRLTRRFLRTDPPDEQDLVALRVHALSQLGPLTERVRSGAWDVACATSGTFRALGDVARSLPDPPPASLGLGFTGIDGRTAPVLTSSTVNLVAGRLARMTARERARIGGVDALRAELLVAGSQVAALAVQAFGLGELVLCPWALREGVILEGLARLRPLPAGADSSPRRRAALDFARKHNVDEPHALTVTALAATLFDQTRALHGLGSRERELLELAGLVHDVGYSVAPSAHHKHSLYLIANSDLAGFEPGELGLIANIARYHRKALPSERHPEFAGLDEAAQGIVRRLGALLRLADALDADHFQVVTDLRVRARGGNVLEIEVEARDIPDLWAADRACDALEAELGARIELVPSQGSRTEGAVTAVPAG